MLLIYKTAHLLKWYTFISQANWSPKSPLKQKTSAIFEQCSWNIGSSACGHPLDYNQDVICHVFSLFTSTIWLFGAEVNPLPLDGILDWSNLKAFADDKINVTEKLKFLLVRLENSGKKRKC